MDLRKGDEALKAEIDAAINKIIFDGTLETILKKWGLWNDAQVEFQAPIRAGTQTAQAQEYTPTTATFNWPEALWRLTRAAAVTVGIALGSMVIAVVLGLPLAVGQWKGPAWLRIFCTFYVEFFRGTPVLVQLLFLYFGLPVIGIAMPGWLTALVGLGLNYAAYESQVYRAALEAIPLGQWEASYSLGMSPLLAFQTDHSSASVSHRPPANDERLRLAIQRHVRCVCHFCLGTRDSLSRTRQRLRTVFASRSGRVGVLSGDEPADGPPRAHA